MTELHAASIQWGSQTHLFLSVDRDHYLEVKSGNLPRSREQAADAAKQVAAMIAGRVSEDGSSRTLPMTYARRFFSQEVENPKVSEVTLYTWSDDTEDWPAKHLKLDGERVS